MSVKNRNENGEVEKIGYAIGQGDDVLDLLSRRTIQRDVPFLLPHIKADSKIIEPGCGPGALTCSAASLATSGWVVGIDKSQTAVDRATLMAKERQVANIDFRVADIYDGLPFEDDTFDLAFCNAFIVYLAWPAEALKEMKRVVKPGGIVAVRDFVDNFWYPSTPALNSIPVYAKRSLTAMGVTEQHGPRLHLIAQEAGFDLARLSVNIRGRTAISLEEKYEIVALSRVMFAEGSEFRRKALEGGVQVEELDILFDDLQRWNTNPEAWAAPLYNEMIYYV